MEFLAMDGFAGYVWPSFLLTLAVMLGNAWWAQRRLRRTLTEALKKGDPSEIPRKPVVREVQ